jgi:hypothetical protein
MQQCQLPVDVVRLASRLSSLDKKQRWEIAQGLIESLLKDFGSAGAL